MKPTFLQYGVRENTASARQHASRLTADSLPLTPDAAPRVLLHRHPTQVSTSLANKSENPINAMPPEGGNRRQGVDCAETISVPATNITTSVLSQTPMTPEPFVSADEAARFLCVKRRYLLELARRGIAGAYALGTGSKRKNWVFRLSELAACIVSKETSTPKPPKPCTIGSGSPR
jgi:hypothetical protein